MKNLDGLTFRHPVDDDLPKAAAVFGAEEHALRGRITYGVDELRDWWRLYDLDHSWIVETVDGDPIAFEGFLARGDEFNAWIGVDPRYIGRGISIELLERAEEHVRELGGDQLKAGTLVENEAARKLLAGLGYREARRFFRMEIDFDGEPLRSDEIEGIEIATFRLEDARAFHAAINDALADDWGFVPMPFDEWKRFRLCAPETDTSLWFIAWDGNDVAGAIRCDGAKFGGGFVGVLGVRRPWRRKGIGATLLRRAFLEYHSRGVSRVSLGVDSENRSGATKLYERVGMHVVSEDVVFEKELE